MSASSYLLTVLGEFVLPNGQQAWTSTILKALGLVDVSERSGRQAILRTGRAGWISTERVGRQARCHLTDSGVRLLAEGAGRIYEFGQPQTEWDGDWLLVITSTEPAREARHRLRTRMAWCGLAPMAPGVWISPDPSREKQAVEELRELGIAGQTFIGQAGALPLGPTSVSDLWKLDDVAARYTAFSDRFGSERAMAASETAAELIELVDQWRIFPLQDPELPLELLPSGWPGTQAAAVFAARRKAWSSPAQAWWQELESDS